MNTLFGILGTTALRLGGDLVDDWGPPRLRAMLAALLTQPGQWMRWDKLTELIWTPETEPKNPCGTLDSYASQLRPVLAQLPGSPRVQTRDRRFRIPVDLNDIDYPRFQELAAQARDCGDPAGAADIALRAIALWRGPALDDLRTEAARRWRRTRSRYELVPAYETLLTSWLALGEPDRVLVTLPRIQEDHPADVRLGMIRISALAARGHRIDATSYYHALRASLLELGDDEGAHQLRAHHDALLHPGSPTRATPPPSPPPQRTPCALPHDFHDFLGRGSQLAALDDAAITADGTPRRGVLLIDGPPGVGKSTLAIHWAHRVHRHVDDVAYFNLNGFSDEEPTDPRSVIDSLLVHLEPGSGGSPSATERHAALQQALAERNVLVVLDNAANTQHVQDLIAALTPCLVLIASRNRLTTLKTRTGAKAITVPPLDPAECAELLTRRIAGRVVLPRPVEEFVAACDGLPMMVDLLAEYLATHTGPPAPPDADGLLFEIGRDGDDHSSPERVLGWSYGALPSPVRRAFRLVGLHPGSDFSLASAAACAGITETAARDALGVLVGAHLLTRAGGRQRYQFHDLLRHYARHQAARDDPAERPRAVRRLLDHYLFSAHAASAALFPAHHARGLDLVCDPGALPASFTTAAEAKDWFTCERTALVHVVTLAAEQGHHGHAWRLADCVSAYLKRDGHLNDCRRVHQLAITAAREDNQLEAEASHRLELGSLLLTEGDHDLARVHLGAARTWAEANGHDRAMEAILKWLGDLELACGAVDSAVVLFRELHRLALRLGDNESLAWAHSALGRGLLQAGRVRDAEFHLHQAQYFCGLLRDDSALALTLEGLAAVHRGRQEWATAENYLDYALSLTATTDLPEAARLHIALAELHLDRGAPAAAEPHAGRGVRLARTINALSTMAHGLDVLGSVHERLDDHQRALIAWTRALHVYSRLRDRVRADQVRARLNGLRPRGTHSPVEPDDDTHSGLL